MANYWRTRVVPLLKIVFRRDASKKAAAADFCKSFDQSIKDEINEELEEKREELEPKVLDIYQASSADMKTLVKGPCEKKLKKHSTSVNKFVHELVKIDFPGSKVVSDALCKYGLHHVIGPVVFLFEKLAAFIPTEAPPPVDVAAAAASLPQEEEGLAAKEKDLEVTMEEKKDVAEDVERTVPMIPPEVVSASSGFNDDDDDGEFNFPKPQ